MDFKEEWLFPGAVVPVDAETTQALVKEIHRLIGLVGGIKLEQQPAAWQGLSDDEIEEIHCTPPRARPRRKFPFARMIEAKLKEKNT